MTATELNTLIAEYGIIAGVTIAVIAFFVAVSKIWPAISKFVHTVDIIISLPDHLEEIHQKLGRVEHEVMTNSGSSLKDAVKRIEDRLSKDS